MRVYRSGWLLVGFGLALIAFSYFLPVWAEAGRYVVPTGAVGVGLYQALRDALVS